MQSIARKAVVLGSVALLLGACQGVGPYGGSGAATLALNRDIVIPAKRVKVYLQDGRLVDAANVYEPYCRFEVLTLSDAPQTIHADAFTVRLMSQTVDDRAGASNEPLFRLAGWDWRRRRSLFDAPQRLYATHFYLQSATQPDVYRLVCGHLQDDDLGARYLRFDEIQQALGTVFSVRFAGSG